MMGLPEPPRRAERTAFWIVVSAGLSTGTSIAVGWLGGLPAGLLALVPVIALSVAGFMKPAFAAACYREWNRLSQRISGRVTQFLLRLCHLTVMASGHLFDTEFKRLMKPPSGHSGWISRTTTPSNAYTATWPEASVHPASGWLGDLVRWSRYSGRYWALALIPYLILLSLVRAKERKAATSNTYTLF